MESLLYDIPSVVVYLDDILVTGKTDINLEKVLQRMETHGLRLNNLWYLHGTRGCLLRPQD